MTTVGEVVDESLRCSRASGRGVRLAAAFLVGAAALALPGKAAKAVPIDSALVITASADFIDLFAEVLGDATQSGTLDVVSGGTAQQSTIADTTVTGLDPLIALLTDTGDGVGATGSIAGSAAGDENFLPIDLSIDVNNTSPTDTFKITFQVDFSNSVDADGADAFAESEFTVDNPSNIEVFFTDLVSDTVNGDLKNGTVLGTSGDLIIDMGTVTFDVTFAPGAMGTILAFLDMVGGAFAAESSYTGSLSGFLSIQTVMNLTEPTPVPEPGTLSLLGAGLIAVFLVLRRRRAVEAMHPARTASIA